jgi:transglutaminase-like putative cysteine protease
VSAPPLLVAAALALWGWQTGHLVPALAIGAAFEGSRLSRRRWPFGREEVRRLSIGCAVMLCAAAAFFLAVTPGGASRALLRLLAWFPFAPAPVLLAQAWGPDGWVDFDALASFRTAVPARARVRVDVSFPFVGIVLVSAGVANTPGVAFEAGLAGIVGWALVARARTAGARLLAAGLVAVAALLGHEGAGALRALQGRVETWVQGALTGGGSADPLRAGTSMGRIGERQLSDEVLFRLSAPDRPPALLREGAYRFWIGGEWLAGDPRTTRPPEVEAGRWRLSAPADGLAPPRRRLRLEGVPAQGRGLLPLPAGTVELAGLPGARVTLGPTGSVAVEVAAGRPEIEVAYSEGSELADPPSRADLTVPGALAPALAGLVDRIGLRPLPPSAAGDALKRWFQREFRYATWEGEGARGADPLLRFLLETRTGHCEYFATATVLLLREAGVPARYATGYAVDERSEREAAWIVRASHAHAWALAWVDGAWRDVDTTPVTWLAEARARRPAWREVADWGAWALHRSSKVRLADLAPAGRAAAVLILGAALLLGARRLARRRQGGGATRQAAARAEERVRRGLDSELFALERALGAKGFPRAAAEPLTEWADRVATAGALPAEALRELIWLHYRLRFDPAGLAPDERARLASQVQRLLQRRLRA